MRPVRVLWLTKGLGRGGAETLLVELARTMDRTGVELSVAYALPHKDALVPSLEALGVPTVCLGTRRGGWLRALGRHLRSERFDVVHTHSPVVASAARLLAPRATVLVHTEHNVWGRYRRPTRLVNALTLRRNEVVWAVSEGVASSIRPPRPGGPPVEVMLHGVAPRESADGPAARSTARARLGVPDDALVVGTVGNLTPKKDHDTLVRAFVEVLRTCPDAHLVIIGTGPRERHLRALVASLGLGGRVHLTGMRDDVPELLPGLDVFTMSSLHEGLSIALVEAMAAGRPVVATRVGGIPEVVRHGEHGLLVRPGDPHGLAAALVEVAVDDAGRARMSEAARVRAADFGLEPAAERLRSAYRAVGERLELHGAGR